MSKWSTRQIATAAIIAALYTVMSLLSSIFGLTYGPIQCRFSEALTVLPFFLPEAVPGLFVGCLVTNLMSTVGPLDIISAPWPRCWQRCGRRRCPTNFWRPCRR